MTLDPGPEIRALIHPYTGELSDARRTERGYSSDLTAVVECEKGPFFVKAMRNRPGGRRDQMIREKLINPFVRPISPALLWVAEGDQWIVLGFEVIDGRPSDFEPDSPDLPTVVDLLNRIEGLELPRVAQSWPETRWNRFTGTNAEVELFRGDALLHTDINPDNMIIGAGKSWVVDWSWPTHGAPFIDPAMLVLQLVAAGHSPESAEAWAARCEAWMNADSKAIDSFAAACVRMQWAFARRRPEESWLKALAEAAEAWANYRGVKVT